MATASALAHICKLHAATDLMGFLVLHSLWLHAWCFAVLIWGTQKMSNANNGTPLKQDSAIHLEGNTHSCQAR